MTGNCVDNHLGNGGVTANCYCSVVSENMIEECKGTAIILDRDCYGITLSSNVIAHEETDGIDLRDAHGCAVSANTFTIVKKAALRIGPKSGRITVTGNNFSNSYIGDGKVKRGTEDIDAGGIVLKDTNEINISGNVFSGVKPADTAVDVSTNCGAIVLTANLFKDCNYAARPDGAAHFGPNEGVRSRIQGYVVNNNSVIDADWKPPRSK